MSIILVIILVAVVLVVYFYNGLVTMNNKVKDAWTDLETQLKKRYDAITVLAEALKDNPEIEQLATLRTKAMQATSLTDKAEAENAFSEGINKVIGGSEKAQEFKDMEDQIQTSRRFYNGTVREFNLKLITLPNNFIASKLGFNQADLFATQSELKSEVAVAPAPVTPAPEPIPVTPEPTPAPVPEVPTPTPVTPEPEPTPEVPETPATPINEPEVASTEPEQVPAEEPAPTPAENQPTAEQPAPAEEPAQAPAQTPLPQQ